MLWAARSIPSPPKEWGAKTAEGAVGDDFLKFHTRNIPSDAEVQGFSARGGFFASTKITVSVNYHLGSSSVCFYKLFWFF